ncbi:MAG: GNAT family N-acetyltransferase [Balneolaceae bacterium]
MIIIELSERPELLDKGIAYFWEKWGNDSNYLFYKDCITNSFEKNNKLPKFYLCLKQSEIIGSYALLTNDLISRQDLMPWFACLYVNEEFRKNGIADQLLNHAIAQTKKKGFKKLYLNTELNNFYEKKGWLHISDGYNASGDLVKIFSKATNAKM